MTSRQLSDFFERSFHWAPCLPCRTASLPCQSWRRTSLTTAPTEVKSQSLQTWRTQSDSWVKEWHFMMYRWLSSTTRTYLVEGGGLTPRVSSWHSDIIKLSSVFFTLIYVNLFNKKTRAAPSKESSHSLKQCNQNWKQNAIILSGGGRRICGSGENVQATSVDDRTSNQNSAINCFWSNFVSHRYGLIWLMRLILRI